MSTTYDPVPLSYHAACRVDGGAVPVFTANRGFTATITRNGAGDYSLFPVAPIDELECFAAPCITEAQTAAGRSISVVNVSDTEVRVTTSDGAALADMDFSLVLLKKFPG